MPQSVFAHALVLLRKWHLPPWCEQGPTPAAFLGIVRTKALRATSTACLALAAALALGFATAAMAAPCPPAPLTAAEVAAAAARSDGKDRGLLWKLSRDGTTSWLYGTVHAGRPAWAAPGPIVARALKDSGVLALEMDPLAPDLQARIAALMAAPRGVTLPSAVTNRLTRQLQESCLPPALIQALHPLAVTTLAQLTVARRAGLYAEYGVDMMLARQARAAGTPVVSLETPELQIRALFGPPGTVDLQEVTATLDSLENGKDTATLERLIAAWDRGDHAELSSYARWCDCLTTPEERAMMRRVLDDRNPALARGIAGLHGPARSVFAAVGALHMTGDLSLLRLLAEQGFEVERVPLRPAP
ncbi:TraB/GumN family protein [Pigmentiphaga litoralis]|uniref:TraB/GumN family protein n=1 Tax=Pigmentiphaga litoralis TaxID=516702 RepID=UPI003B4288C2